MSRFLLTGILVVMVLSPMLAAAGELGFGPERRKDQFPEDSGYLLAPLPYSMPGIGNGFFHLGHFTNLLNSTSDVTLIGVTGAAKGMVAVLDEIPLVNKHLYFRSEILNITKVQVAQYPTRGMDSNGNDYDLLGVSAYQNRTVALDLVYFERRLRFSVDRRLIKGDLDTIRDSDGEVKVSFAEPYRFRDRRSMFSAQLDLTDDYLDPRHGFRLGLSYIDAPRVNANNADFAVTDLNATWYVPTTGADTLVLNYYQSDAHVREKGVTDPAVIQAELGITCAPADIACQASLDRLIGDTINARRYGTANSLGGEHRFRAYPQDRFQGAHVSFVGAEYRWNFVREATPFNFFIWKDTHTGFQLAFFAEYASVAETWGDIWQESRFSAGTGFRLVTASGSVYRADLGVGDEGSQFSLFFYYPW